jgi:seryl-tRNA synthetase
MSFIGVMGIIEGMLDIRFVRDHADEVQENASRKGYDVKISELLKLDQSKRELQQQTDELRAKRNEIASRMKGGEPTDELVAEGRKVKDKLNSLEQELKTTDAKLNILLEQVPNMLQTDVPIGGEELSVEVKKWGIQEMGAIDHLDYAVSRGWVDFERGAKVAGAKFYYLKGDLAMLENAITQFALDFVVKKDFIFMTVPHVVNSRVAMGTGFSPRASEQSDEYFIEGEDLSLIATAEIPLTGYHADEIVEEKDLPLLYAGISPCYRKEAGTYGKHTRGLFRVHQFNKLEMYALTLPERSVEMHERILEIEEELWQILGIPYHVINIASGDLGAPAAKKYDIEYWSKVDGNYRELTSCSNCTDFQARNLNIRVRRQDGTVEVLHTLNGTVVSLARSLVAVIEHYQTDNGKLRIPEALRPYLGGREVL